MRGMEDATTPTLLTTQQLARELHLGSSTVRGYAQDLLIPFVETPGGHRRFDLRAVKAALALHKPANLEPLSADEAPRLSDDLLEDFTRVQDWNTITSAERRDRDIEDLDKRDLAELAPFIGVPGSSRYVIGEGARV